MDKIVAEILKCIKVYNQKVTTIPLLLKQPHIILTQLTKLSIIIETK